MERPLIYGKGPEEKIVQDLIKFLTERQWQVKRTVGNLWQSGFPDLWIGHRDWGHRWVDAKNPTSYRFTPAQLAFWPIMQACGDGVWILTAATPSEYAKLFAPCNWQFYLWKIRHSDGRTDGK